MKKVDKKKTLAYAVAFYFDGKVDFLMGNKTSTLILSTMKGKTVEGLILSKLFTTTKQ